MPSPLAGKLTIRDLLRITHQYMGNRFDYAKRDFVKLIKIQSVSVYDGKAPGKARTKFIVKSRSTPNYKPYFTGIDSRGRPRGFQRLIHHQYDVTVSLDKLSINVPVKLRVGSEKKPLFGPKTKAQFAPGQKLVMKNGKVIRRAKPGKMLRDDLNVLRGINLDQFYRFDWVYWENGILFGRNWAAWPPVKTNPHRYPALTKHALTVILTLIKLGKLKR